MTIDFYSEEIRQALRDVLDAEGYVRLPRTEQTQDSGKCEMRKPMLESLGWRAMGARMQIFSHNCICVAANVERTHSRTIQRWRARIREFGLFAYGGTPDEAEEKLSKMFATWINLHGESGTLKEELERSGLKWWIGETWREPRSVLDSAPDMLNWDGFCPKCADSYRFCEECRERIRRTELSQPLIYILPTESEFPIPTESGHYWARMRKQDPYYPVSCVWSTILERYLTRWINGYTYPLEVFESWGPRIPDWKG